MDSQGRNLPTRAIELLPLSQIARNKDNARGHSAKQIAKLAQGIRQDFARHRSNWPNANSRAEARRPSRP